MHHDLSFEIECRQKMPEEIYNVMETATALHDFYIRFAKIQISCSNFVVKITYLYYDAFKRISVTLTFAILVIRNM